MSLREKLRIDLKKSLVEMGFVNKGHKLVLNETTVEFMENDAYGPRIDIKNSLARAQVFGANPDNICSVINGFLKMSLFRDEKHRKRRQS